MRIRHVLVIYKHSVYQAHGTPQLRSAVHPSLQEDLSRMERAHAAHVSAVAQVEAALRARHVHYDLAHRDMPQDMSRYDLVITVGGDGTFLRAAQRMTTQYILGINSDPARSRGHFCRVTAATFASALDQLLDHAPRVIPLQRLMLSRNGQRIGPPILNDILLAHQNPASMSRYWLEVDGQCEMQRSSGLWIATAAGSTGAMRSAGGEVLPLESTTFQYRPRELDAGVTYQLTGHHVPANQVMRIGSLMREGAVYLDGMHTRVPLQYGDVLHVKTASQPLQMISSMYAGVPRKSLTIPELADDGMHLLHTQ